MYTITLEEVCSSIPISSDNYTNTLRTLKITLNGNRQSVRLESPLVATKEHQPTMSVGQNVFVRYIQNSFVSDEDLRDQNVVLLQSTVLREMLDITTDMAVAMSHQQPTMQPLCQIAPSVGTTPHA